MFKWSGHPYITHNVNFTPVYTTVYKHNAGSYYLEISSSLCRNQPGNVLSTELYF